MKKLKESRTEVVVAVIGLIGVLGAAAIATWDRAREEVGKAAADEDGASLVTDANPLSGPASATHEAQPPAVISSSSEHVVRFADGSVAVLTGPLGIAIVELTNTGHCRANYRWRHSAPPYATETSGTGELFEQYAGVLKQDGKNHVTDVGGQLRVAAGPYLIEWSCGGVLYGRPPEVVVAGATYVSFEEFRFGAGSSGWIAPAASN